MIARTVGGILLGVIIGCIVMMCGHYFSTFVYPFPDGLTMSDMMGEDVETLHKFHQWLSTLPAPAFLLASVCHAMGCFAGAIITGIISRSSLALLFIGAWFTLGGWLNLNSLPHPDWLPFVDLPLYAIATLLAFLITRQKPSHDKTQ